MISFVRFTLADITGFGGEPIYISLAHIEAIRGDDGFTVIFVTGDNNAKYYVKESLDAVMTMINKEECKNENDND